MNVMSQSRKGEWAEGKRLRWLDDWTALLNIIFVMFYVSLTFDQFRVIQQKLPLGYNLQRRYKNMV
jgi:hypothetical protein